MSEKKYKAAVITMSDKGYRGERSDTSGPAIMQILKEKGMEVVEYFLIPDEFEVITYHLKKLCDEEVCDLIITTGGTGCAKRDVTPEATKSVIEKEIPGIAEAIRYKSLQITPKAMLGRGVAGICNNTMIINLPGSEKAVRESMEVFIDVVPHALDTLKGKAEDCGRE